MALLIAGLNSRWTGNTAPVTPEIAQTPYSPVARQSDMRSLTSWDASVETVDSLTTTQWDFLKSLKTPVGLSYEGFEEHVEVRRGAGTGGAKPLDTQVKENWNFYAPVDKQFVVFYFGSLPVKDKVWTHRHYTVHLKVNIVDLSEYRYYLPTFNLPMRGAFDGYSFDFSDPTGVAPELPILPIEIRTEERWKKFITSDRAFRIPWGWSLNRSITGKQYVNNFVVPEITEEELNPITVDIDEVYRVVNIVEMRTLPDDTPIAFSQATISRDIDTFAWTLNATILNQASLDLVSPKDGTLKYVKVEINGERWDFFISKVSERENFGKKAWSVTGYSRTKLLAVPYSQLESGLETTLSTAAQIATNLMVGTGFTIDWNAVDAVDWAIPADVFSYTSKSPVSALALLTNAVGHVIEPHKYNPSLKVRKRYRYSPWNWVTEIPDRQLPIALFNSVNHEYQPKQVCNGVYVSGQEHGALAKVKRLGTAGDVLLPDIVDNLLTDLVANTERGRTALAQAGHKEIFSGSITHTPSISLVDINELVQVVEMEGGSWMGTVQSVSYTIALMGASVKQNISIERHYE